jgi:alkylhydroperoxidase family enzyme
MPRIEPVPSDDLPEEVRTHIDEGRRRGTVTGTSMHVFAHSPFVALNIVDGSNRRFRGRLEGRLIELMRLRSAQLGACGPCSEARKDPSVTEEDVACLMDADRMGLRREALAIGIVDLMGTDHDAIDATVILELAQVFDTEEIVELLYRAGTMIGMHRFVHVLDVLGETAAVLPYDAEAVRASWDRAYGVAAQPGTT